MHPCANCKIQDHCPHEWNLRHANTNGLRVREVSCRWYRHMTLEERARYETMETIMDALERTIELGGMSR